MSDYQNIKRLDEKSAQKLTEGTGPSDQCICSLLYEQKERGFRQSIKKAFSFVAGKRNRNSRDQGEFRNSNTAGLQLVSKEVVKRKGSCGKCGCDNNDVIMNHSYANIRIVTPDISSICPCPTDCLPDKKSLQNNIKVTIERLEVNNTDDTSRNADDTERRPRDVSVGTSSAQTSSSAESTSRTVRS